MALALDEEQAALLRMVELPSWCELFEIDGQIVFQMEPSNERVCYLISHGKQSDYSYGIPLPPQREGVTDNLRKGITEFLYWLDKQENLEHNPS